MANSLRYDAGAGAYDRLTGRWSRMYNAGVMRATAVRTGSHVLDVATGTGDAAILATELVGPKGRVVGLDISAPMLRVAEAKAAGRPVEFVEADASRMPFPDGTFDVLVSLFGLMFLPDQAAALIEFRRVLRREGSVAATCWDQPRRVPFAGLVAEALSRQLPGIRDDLLRPFSLSDPDVNLALLKAAGFADVRIELETHVSRFSSFTDDFWEPIEAGGGRLGQAYLALSPSTRETVRQEVLDRLAVQKPDEPFTLEHSAWIVVGSC